MIKTIAKIACVALLMSGAACKKDKKAGKGEKAEKAEKTTEKVEQKPEVEKPKLDTPDDRVAFVRGCYDAFNAKDMDKFGACLAEDVSAEMPDSGMPAIAGRAAFADHLKGFQTAFPDLKVTPTLLLASTQNKVASVVVSTGTNSGPMKMGDHEMPATNKKMGITELHIFEIDPAKGGISKMWNFFDQGTMMGQMGMNPMPHRAAVETPSGEPTVVIAKDDDAEKANLELVKKNAEAWMKHDQKAISAVLDDKVVMHDMSAPADRDKKSGDKFTAEVIKAFPDAKGEIVDSWAAGDYLVTVVTNSGTNKGPMPSMGLKKPTNKPMSFTSGDIVKVAGGKVVESWMFYNGMAIAQQLGLVPDMPAGGDKAAAPEGDKAAAPEGDKAPAGDKKAEEKKPAAEGGAGGN